MGEDFLSGSGILIITKSSIEALLHVGKAKKKKLLIIYTFTVLLSHTFFPQKSNYPKA